MATARVRLIYNGMTCEAWVWRSRGSSRTELCGHHARWAMRDRGDMPWRGLCAVHIDRETSWGVPDVIDLVGGKLPADPEAAALAFRAEITALLS